MNMNGIWSLQVQAGNWYNSVDSNGYLRRKTATQYHDVIGFCIGKWFAALAQFLTGLYILGVAIQQVVASSSSQYTIDTKFDKRCFSFLILPQECPYSCIDRLPWSCLAQHIGLASLSFLATDAWCSCRPGKVTSINSINC